MMIFLGLAAINTQANLLFGMFGLMIGILLVSGVISRIVLARVEIERHLPDHAIVGRPMVIPYVVNNRKRFWPSLSLTISELDGADAFDRQPTTYLLHAAPRTAASIPATLVPLRRGVIEFDRYQVSTSFPFGFVKRARDRRHKQALLALPTLGVTQPAIFRMFRSAESTGINVRPSPGGNDDFYGLRAFREGENPRFIYWRRSARTGQLVVREMTRVSPPKILVLVDTYNANGDRARAVVVERVLAMAATLINDSLAAGMPVGLTLWSGDWVATAPSRGKRHRLDLLSQLARVGENTRQPCDALLSHTHGGTLSDVTMVLLTPDDLPSGAPGRGARVTLSGAEPGWRRYFQFDPNMEFEPPEKMPPKDPGKDSSRKRSKRRKSKSKVGRSV